MTEAPTQAAPESRYQGLLRNVFSGHLTSALTSVNREDRRARRADHDARLSRPARDRPAEAARAACVRVPGRKEERQQAVRTFGTMAGDLLALHDWLQAEGVTHVAMESTGVYWKSNRAAKHRPMEAEAHCTLGEIRAHQDPSSPASAEEFYQAVLALTTGGRACVRWLRAAAWGSAK
jgi:hypothetical protein